MTQGDAVIKALREWTDGKFSGDLTFVYRFGRLLHIRHGRIDFVDENGKSALGAPVPMCPACGQPMRSRDGGALFVCDACSVKRTAAQLKRG